MYMKVFICWSGERSKKVANALYEWLPFVIQAVKPWMSEPEIAKGARWSPEVAKALEETSFGIVCVTPENPNAPWLLFETGALSKTVAGTFVCPYLLGVKPTDLEGPLTQFQAALAEQKDTLGLVKSINAAQNEAPLPQQSLEEAFAVWWPRLEKQLRDIEKQPLAEKQKTRDGTELLEEILQTVRQLNIRSTNALPQRPRWEPSEAQKAAAMEAATAAPKVLALLSASAVPMFPSAIASELNISEKAAMDALNLLHARREAANARDAEGRRYVTWIAKKG
jgi:hypothetical protein